MEAQDIIDTVNSGILWEARQKAANHEPLTFEQTNAVRLAAELFDKLEQMGESVIENITA